MDKMDETVISVKDVWREFKTSKKEAGLMASIRSLIKRDSVIENALKGVSLEVKKGEMVGLIGPNGAGKSTLIKILTGVLFPSKGDVHVLNFIPWKQRTKYVENIGVIFGQKTQLWWDIPALDTFELHKELYSIPKDEFEKRRDYMVKLLGIEELVKKPVRQLSLGERMRCELVLCLLHKPKMVFLDEPTIGLDIIAKDKIRDFIKEFNKNYKTTFIITTHDMADIEKLCKRIIIINHGSIVYDGLLEEIRKKFANYKIVDCKFSEPISTSNFSFRNCKILKGNKHELLLELDLTKAKISNLINYLIKKYGDDIEDIDIQEPPIEEIIKLIYKRK